MIHVDLMMLGFISGSLIPLATGLLTKLTAHPGLKAFVSAFLAAVVAVVAYLTSANGVGTMKEAVFLFFTAWIAHAGSYHGFLKPTGVAGEVQTATASVGIG